MTAATTARAARDGVATPLPRRQLQRKRLGTKSSRPPRRRPGCGRECGACGQSCKSSVYFGGKGIPFRGVGGSIRKLSYSFPQTAQTRVKALWPHLPQTPEQVRRRHLQAQTRRRQANERRYKRKRGGECGGKRRAFGGSSLLPGSIVPRREIAEMFVEATKQEIMALVTGT